MISCTIVGMGVFVIFHYLWLACTDYRADCRQQNTNPPVHHRNIFPSVWRWLAPASDFPSSSLAFILIYVPFASTLSRSLEVSLTCAFTNVLLSPSCFHSRLVVGDKIVFFTLDNFSYCFLRAKS